MYILQSEFLLISFRADFALKTRSLTFLVANFTMICLCCPSLILPHLWDTDMSCGSTGGSTLMRLETFSTAASVSSWLGFSGMPATRRLSLRPCCSRSSSKVCWSLFDGNDFTVLLTDLLLERLSLVVDFRRDYIRKQFFVISNNVLEQHLDVWQLTGLHQHQRMLVRGHISHSYNVTWGHRSRSKYDHLGKSSLIAIDHALL